MDAVESHELALRDEVEAGLRTIPGVEIFSRAPHRSSQVLFAVAGLAPAAVWTALAGRGVNAPAGTFYAIECARWLGLGDTGAVRAGMSPYTNHDDVQRLVQGVTELAGAVAKARAG